MMSLGLFNCHSQPSMQAVGEASIAPSLTVFFFFFTCDKVSYYQHKYKLKCTKGTLQPKKSEQTNKSSLMTRGRVGSHESAEHKPKPPWSSQHFS